MQAPKRARLSGLAPGGKRLHGVVEGQRQETHHAVGHVELDPDQLGQRQQERRAIAWGPADAIASSGGASMTGPSHGGQAP